MGSITRRNFLAASAVTAGLVGLAGCDASGGGASDSLTAPAVDAYPIEPDAEGVEARWASEETRDGWTRVTQEGGAELGVMDEARIIQVDGYAFRDMNGNGKLDLYEDWRQPAAERAKALVANFTAEEANLLMWHGGVEDKSESAEDPEFGLVVKGSCAGVSRFSTDLESHAADIAWVNKVQGMCEQRAYGIPYVVSADPYRTLDIPSVVALASAMDKDLWRKAGMWTSRAWRASGVRLELGPQVDLYTHPTVVRLYGAQTEDPALARDFTKAFAGGMQSTWGDDEATDDLGWGKDSVATMLKHFVGAGAIETGCDDHNDQGKYGVFPGGNYAAHLIPFLDGGMHLDSKTEQMASVMPNYGISYSEDEAYGELVGGGFNQKQLGVLRDAGWDGMICTDWNILKTGRGVEALSTEERYKKMVDAGIDQYGGGFDPEVSGAYALERLGAELGEEGALERVRESARRVATLMVNVGLFDQPYSDRAVARKIFESEAAAAFAREANDRCVIMLKNSEGVLSSAGVESGAKVYIPLEFIAATSGPGGSTPSSVRLCIDESEAIGRFEVVTDAVAEPSGEVNDRGEAQYQESDIVRADAEDLADVDYAIVKVMNPQDAYKGFSGGSQMGAGDSGEPLVYKPISLQYRPYTADGPSVKKTSIAGDALGDGSKENRSHYGESTYATNESSLDLVIDTRAKLPKNAKLILVVSADHPMVFSEIEPYADVILMGWRSAAATEAGSGVSDGAFLRVIAGEVEPSALLQFQMPASMEAVEAQLEDVPRDMECYTDAEGNTYDFCFGLNWSGVIDDERTKAYKANPLTRPETEVMADA